jgi:hypothetical protein
LLPTLRGSAIYGRSDILTHVGFVEDIVSYGTINIDVGDWHIDHPVYPFVHILSSIIVLISNLNPWLTVAFVIPPIFLLIMYAGTYMLAKKLFSLNRVARLATLFSIVPLFRELEIQVLPYFASTALIPFILSLFFACSNNKLRLNILFLILIFPFVFLHPLACINLITGLAIIEISRLFFRNKLHKKTSPHMLLYPIILFTSFVQWLWLNWYHWWLIVKALSDVITGISPGAYKEIADAFASVHFSWFNIVELFLKMYGHILLFILLTLMAAVILIHEKREGKCNLNALSLLSYFFFFFLIGLFYLTRGGGLGYWRYIISFVIITPIFAGYAIERLYERLKSFDVKYLKLLLIFILILSFLLGMCCFYPSPYVKQPNHQVSYAEITGLKWYYNSKDITLPTFSINPKFVFAELLFGLQESWNRGDILYPPYATFEGEISAPNHFNYRKGKIGYMPISKYDRIFCTHVYPEIGNFTEDDFNKLNYMQNMNKVYENGDLNIWFVNMI